ncbi:hypothetical protein WICMUC_004265 [Wickerhamomyces mucosus]|uniref:J domain-containing protein n=1 Tax=Wickerhamomyces mucosus TaxID=1378264 RepID=A0A9P8PJA7_9ASCO|nr:hypothetical protein WICMUC_004265 [Wickerhamomyces mucosus]
MKTDYYILLDVESTASDSQLKKAYRKKALQFHPDKNPDDIERATQIFAEIRLAYEVLSDPQERAWYDAHKSQILREDSDRGATNDEDYVDPDITGLTTEDILKYFDPSLYTRIDDSHTGIYQSAGRLFNKLAEEEILAGRQQGLKGYSSYQDDDPNDTTNILYPKIGSTKSDYSSDIRNFYQVWSSFSTVKTFSWCDEYRYSTAGDRRTRRAMERENKKSRDTAKKEYNETIRKFVTFLKKRDPRVKEGMVKFEQERKRKQQEDLLRQIERDRANNLDKEQFEIQNWQKIDDFEFQEIENHFVSDNEEIKDEDSALEIIECLICDKTFKNQKQFESHEASTKHKKALNKLKWEMKQEGISLGIDAVSDVSDFDTADEEQITDVNESDYIEDDYEDDDFDENYEEELRKIEEQLKNLGHDEDEDDELEEETFSAAQSEYTYEKIPTVDLSQDFEIDDEIESDVEDIKPKKLSKKEKKKQKYSKPALTKEHNDEEEKDELTKLAAALEKGKAIGVDDSDDTEWGNSQKKQKKKRAKKSADGTSQPSDSKEEVSKESSPQPPLGAEKCSVCSQQFSSRNKLFQHVNATGHAAPPPKKSKGKKKR